MRKKVLFTDIDGTLTNIVTGEYLCSKAVIQALKESDVPVILCSAKTMAEQEPIRQQLGLSDPFIVENGGAVVVPKDYFDIDIMSHEDGKRVGEFRIVELGKSVSVIREKLNVLRRESNLQFLTVGDLSIDQLSCITQLKPNVAKLMAERNFAETILHINEDDLPDFSERAQLMGLKVIYGGKFIDVTAGNDKGKAVRFLMSCFRKLYGGNIKFFGIGDSPNDASMLYEVDVPMLVQKPDKTWSSLGIKNITHLPGIGPNGFKYVLETIME